MKTLLSAAGALLVATTAVHALQIDYPALWEKGTPFHVFLENVKARQDQWKPWLCSRPKLIVAFVEGFLVSPEGIELWFGTSANWLMAHDFWS